MFMPMETVLRLYVPECDHLTMLTKLWSADAPVVLDWDYLESPAYDAESGNEAGAIVTQYADCILYNDDDVLQSTVCIYWKIDGDLIDEFNTLEEAKDAYEDCICWMH